jgi:hypothetical protein
MESSFTDRWIRRFRIITLSLIFSGALNIGLIAAFIAVLIQDRKGAYSVAAMRSADRAEETTNQALLISYERLSFRELSSLLTNTDLVEEGFAKRDLALAALVSFHDFNIEKAIGGMPAQRRLLKLGERSVEIFPNLSGEQFQAIVQYAYLERWPLTTHGLFQALQKNTKLRDEALVQAMTVTPEFYALQTLFQKSGANPSQEQLVDLIRDGNWQMLDGFVREQSQMLDLSDERRRRLLLSYLAMQSPAAANLLLQTDFIFALKRLDDQGILDLLSHAAISETLQKFCIELLQSPRRDAIYEKSSQILYRMANEEMPLPFDLLKARSRFVPSAPAVQVEAVPKKEAAGVVRPGSLRTHVVKEGDSLWKIARHYHVKLEDLTAINHLESDRLKLGTVLKIPASYGTGSKPPR